MRVSWTALKQAINTLIFTMHTVHIEYQTQESNREMNNILVCIVKRENVLDTGVCDMLRILNMLTTQPGPPKICCIDVITSFANNDTIIAYVFVNMMLFA